jgi:acetyl-CoA synthetase
MHIRTSQTHIMLRRSHNIGVSAQHPGEAREAASRQCFKWILATRLQGYYFSGDGCRRDADGYYWITGRVDDVINVSGHRIGTAEVESALVSHKACAEAAVVG